MNIEVGWRIQENDIVSRYREYEAANPLTQHEVRCDAFEFPPFAFALFKS